MKQEHFAGDIRSQKLQMNGKLNQIDGHIWRRWMNSETRSGFIHVWDPGFGRITKSGTHTVSSQITDTIQKPLLIFIPLLECTRLCSRDCIPTFHCCTSIQCPEHMSSLETAFSQLSTSIVKLSQTLKNY